MRFNIQFQDPLKLVLDNTNLIDRSTALAIEGGVKSLKAIYEYSKSNPSNFFNTANLLNAQGAAQALVASAIAANAREAEAARYSARVDIIRNEHIRACAGGRYWVRSFSWKYGKGLLIVDVKQGRWTELPSIVLEESYGANEFLNSLPLFVSGDQATFVVKGMSLDPAKWKNDERIIHKRTVHKSLMAFGVAQLKWRPISEFNERSWVKTK